MQPHQTNRECPNCRKEISNVELRWADYIPEDVVRYQYSRTRIVIGRIFHHDDGTICDQSLFSIKPLQKPAWLHLGDRNRDPRVKIE